MYFLKDPDECAKIIHDELTKVHDLPENDDQFLTISQVKGLILERCKKKGSRLMANDKILEKVANQAQSILLGSYMAKMAVEGELECAWDEKANDMIWWLPPKKD